MSNVACDWFIVWLYVARGVNDKVKNNAFSMFVIKKYGDNNIQIFNSGWHIVIYTVRNHVLQ